ncbi:unnamed protein product [marine sediment metagenome]|uniref:Uncharacterized protein n=1 Tax=marine sediment metagenome TaxID=412755 RepID=X1PE11_9ZZZZ
MSQRDDLFKKFGPILFESSVISILELVNESRRARGWPEITLQDFYDKVNNHITELEPYDWMNEEI